MDQKIKTTQTFQAMLRANAKAAQFYDSCDTQQKQAILSQLHQFQTPEKMEAFVQNLPSAAL